jgi:hypothetical protein
VEENKLGAIAVDVKIFYYNSVILQDNIKRR